MPAHLHTSPPAIAARLKRAEGHIRSIIVMMETGRPCLDIALQLHAVEKSETQAKRVLIQDHIDHCLEHIADPPSAEGRTRIYELKTIAKYL